MGARNWASYSGWARTGSVVVPPVVAPWNSGLFDYLITPTGGGATATRLSDGSLVSTSSDFGAVANAAFAAGGTGASVGVARGSYTAHSPARMTAEGQSLIAPHAMRIYSTTPADVGTVVTAASDFPAKRAMVEMVDVRGCVTRCLDLACAGFAQYGGLSAGNRNQFQWCSASQMLGNSGADPGVGFVYTTSSLGGSNDFYAAQGSFECTVDGASGANTLPIWIVQGTGVGTAPYTAASSFGPTDGSIAGDFRFRGCDTGLTNAGMGGWQVSDGHLTMALTNPLVAWSGADWFFSNVYFDSSVGDKFTTASPSGTMVGCHFAADSQLNASSSCLLLNTAQEITLVGNTFDVTTGTTNNFLYFCEFVTAGVHLDGFAAVGNVGKYRTAKVNVTAITNSTDGAPNGAFANNYIRAV